MHLWSDYEGKTIAGAYPLGQLIRPEGRTAFFSTSNGTGIPAVIRLTESLNDEGEMLERWRQVTAVNQDNLVAIKSFGQTNFEGTPLAYALLELTDASLADILAERALTPQEAHEVASSLLAALQALHASGLVHEHIEPANVMAVGEVIKLRSDCVRECILNPDDATPAHCAELKQRDVHDLAVLLLQVLTLQKKLTPAIKLPAPFDKIVSYGIDGTWGLTEIDAALHPPVIKPLVPESVIAAATQQHPQRISPSPQSESPNPALHVRRISNTVQPAPRSMAFWAACSAGALVLIFLAWLFLHGSSKPATPVPTAAVVTPAKPQTIDDAPTPKLSASASTDGVVHTAVATSQTQAGWHVVAFTYNREDQAWHKVATIRDAHPALSPEVFAPSGRGPFLVALGGAMSESEANVMRNKARRDGMPRDTFIRRYGPR
ncbi:sporulation domain-containing protein [Granulicella tundricola]|uniref:Sporulation domain-containing protein n=1 Tax=Granulicella tundricola (strain ATCC BAA-1859 / DSM 23138 / MP5ACTX9) TaxID=1198114 RepID=E8WZ67_GRATM|nr:sporulation domain-containing protein [Granulicella tundricola]ADW67669.1 sporulation domain-containing protein [Granulicella tundricola MP5ACTX9]